MGQGEELLRLEPTFMKIIHAMCEDHNWHIRRWNAQYLAEFLNVEMYRTKTVMQQLNKASIPQVEMSRRERFKSQAGVGSFESMMNAGGDLKIEEDNFFTEVNQ